MSKQDTKKTNKKGAITPKDDVINSKDSKETAQKAIEDIYNEHGAYFIETIIDQLAKKNNTEPILNPEQRRLTIKPIKYQNIWKKYNDQLANFWVAKEIDFSNDYDDFVLLSKDEQVFVEMVLAFFAASDGIVNLNLSERFMKDIQITEAVVAYQFQQAMENIHGEVYSEMLDNIVKDNDRKEFLFNAIVNIPSIKLMKDWAFKWIESSKTFAHRLVAFAIVEGIFFSGAFAAIFWLKKYKNEAKTNTSCRPFMEGLIKSNKLISRDEGQHVEFACELYGLLENKLTALEVNEIIKDGTKVAQEFMTDAIPVKLIGMNNRVMNDYIEYIADRLLVDLGYKKIFNKANPFKFMETIGLSDKTNFHESRPHEYQNANVNQQSQKTSVVAYSDDF